jgi:peptidoglycan hydrolase CwlO-like protein
MDEIKPATETIAPTIAPEEDLESKYAAIEAEKTRLSEQRENYRKAEEKYKERLNNLPNPDETDDDRLRRIAREELANSHSVELLREQDEIIRKALKENKELKLAQLNKTAPPAAMGAHSESTPVTDTLVTPEQMTYFKSQGWSDTKIAAYKENLLKKR